jgi:hypothetical protein
MKEKWTKNTLNRHVKKKIQHMARRQKVYMYASKCHCHGKFSHIDNPFLKVEGSNCLAEGYQSENNHIAADT